MKNYELIEHTADIGIRVKGKDLPELFSAAALALFDIIAEEKPGMLFEQKEIRISLLAQGIEELFVNWLNEVLSLSAVEEVVFTEFKFNKFSDKGLEVTAKGNNAVAYKFNVEIKAATYHSLKLVQINNYWQAEVILDV